MTISRRDFLVGSVAALPATLAISAASEAHDGVPVGWKLPAKNSYTHIENEWIPLKDGGRLAVRLWIPDQAQQEPVPVVLEYLPYRKRDGTRGDDDSHAAYLAEHGIAFARVDVRGSGDSAGVLRGEYESQELLDGVTAIGWLAQQRWSNGSVGMRGHSWGGINSLLIAGLSPPELKAIMPMCFSDDRYTDDAHFLGGTLGLVNFQWGTMYQCVVGAPPDPAVFGDRWREEWLARLDGMSPVLAQWTQHQRADSYWRRASARPDYLRIRCPVYCVGGWEDAYSNSIGRALSELTVPRKALIGPWAHNSPDLADPGPALDWAQEEVRWWEHWLKGVATGIMDEPMFRFYMPDAKATQTYPHDTPGRWVAEKSWPSRRISPLVLYLNADSLDATARNPTTILYKADAIVGLQRMEWLPFNNQTDLAREQTPDDKHSLCFSSPPLDNDFEMVGTPLLRVRVSANVPVAHVAVRLTEVTQSGQSFLVTYGLINLTHRVSHERPMPLTPGVFYDVEVPLNFMAHRFKGGNQVRVAISESLWPLAWPSPQPVTLAIVTGSSSITLPIRPRPLSEPAFLIPMIRDDARNVIDGAQQESGVTVTVSGPDSAGRIVVEKHWPPDTSTIKATGTTVGKGWRHWRMDATQAEPNSCHWQGDCIQSFERPDWGECSVKSSFKMSSTADVFHLQETFVATQNKKVIYERTWRHSVKRDLV